MPDKKTKPVCKYGTDCYQKNPFHRAQFSHPKTLGDSKRSKIQQEKQPEKKVKLSEDEVKNIHQMSDSDSSDNEGAVKKCSTPPADSEEALTNNKPLLKALSTSLKITDYKQFIKEKFLMDMPEDFFSFWDFVKQLNCRDPCNALQEVGVTLVGPYDVLAGKFNDKNDLSEEEYLIHWRYFYDIPEVQTVLQGENGFHIGYFRDDPNELPCMLVSNNAKENGTFTSIGCNIFAAVNSYLEDFSKTASPFLKLNTTQLQTKIKTKANELKLNLALKPEKLRLRDHKAVTRTFNKIGLVVPYNKKTQLGYRELAMSDRELKTALNKLEAAEDKKEESEILSQLQSVFTYARIAADECDFGTGVELGWNIICHGTTKLNLTASRFLSTSYNLLGREAFGKIAEAHMKNRRKGYDLSVL